MKIKLRPAIITGLLIAVIAGIFTIIAYYVPIIRADMAPDISEIGAIEGIPTGPIETVPSYIGTSDAGTYQFLGDGGLFSVQPSGTVEIPSGTPLPSGMIYSESGNTALYDWVDAEGNINYGTYQEYLAGSPVTGIEEIQLGENMSAPSTEFLTNENYLQYNVESGTGTEPLSNIFSYDIYSAYVQGQGEAIQQYEQFQGYADLEAMANDIGSLGNTKAYFDVNEILKDNSTVQDIQNLIKNNNVNVSPSTFQQLKNLAAQGDPRAQSLLNQLSPLYNQTDPFNPMAYTTNTAVLNPQNIKSMNPITDSSGKTVAYLATDANGNNSILTPAEKSLIESAQSGGQGSTITKSALDNFLNQTGAKFDSKTGIVTDSSGNPIAHLTQKAGSSDLTLDNLTPSGLGQLAQTGASGSFGSNLPDWIKGFYGWAVGIAGLLATAVLIYAGYLYATSAGNPEQVNLAKEYVIGALSGLAFLLLAVIIYNTIKVNSSTNSSTTGASTGVNAGTQQ